MAPVFVLPITIPSLSSSEEIYEFYKKIKKTREKGNLKF
jgi:hypothetical protein